MQKPSPHCSMKSGKAGKNAGAGHAAYIGAGGKYAEREDVIGLFDRNLPSWAKDGVEFFAAADKLERANGRAYTEIEAAIPRSVADPVAYASGYAEKILGKDHPYRLAVHDKPAADGGRNIHLHLMFSERKLDGIERDREHFFKRAAAPYRHRVTKEMMPADPAKGGAIKDRKWNDRDQVQVVRDSWQEYAKAHGIDLDLRSNAAKGLGVPEPKIGPEHPRAGANPARQARMAEMERLRAVRAIKAELHAINHQEKQHVRTHRDQARHHQPATDLAQMRDVWGVDNLHDLGRPQDLLQQNAPDHLRPQQATAAPARLHKLAAARAGVAAAEAERQAAAKQARADAEARRKAAWIARGQRRRSGTPNRVMRLDQAKTQDGRTVYRWGGNGPSAGKVAVIQNGTRLSAAGKYSQPKAAAMAYIAKQNGWQSVTITGDDAFKAMALPELLAQGITVQNPELQPQIQALQAQAEQQRQAIAKEQEAIKPTGINPKSRYHPDNIAKAAAEAAAAGPVKKPPDPYRGMNNTERILAQRAAAKADAVPAATPSTVSEPKERDRDVAAPAPQHSELNERERDLAQQIAAAIQSNDPKQLRACQARLLMVKRDAAQALAAVEPQEVNRAAIEHAIKTMQNDAARKNRQPEPWHMSGIDRKTGVCVWDGKAQDAAQALQDHLKTPRPQGIFGRDTAGTKAWMRRADALSGNAQDWLAATDTLKKEFSLGIAQQVEKESQDNAARNRRNDPEHARQLERCKSLADLEKQLEKALQPHRERQRRIVTPSRGMKR